MRDVLFLHPVGLDFQASKWLDVPRLRPVTLTGHGDRMRVRGSLSLEAMADEILGWTHEPVHLVGCSMGGMVALRFALEHPERVASLVLGFTTAQVSRDAMLDRATMTEQRNQAELADETMARWFTPAALDREPLADPVEYTRLRLLYGDRFALADTWRAVAEHDVLDQLGRISAPTTCIAGLRDQSTPMAAMEAIAGGIPGAELVTIDGPHMAFLEQPEEFSALVRAHLDRVGA